ncbi:MAG: TetR family transcriptional regulator [Candidatus Andeanibacterium colombiense]|uniref:TetR family transcriptional regulator n=1 Tax=Candidatus Andeanibacterium colombiense TaxID=3121345 RepID=A0AAJ5X8I8_9SPHN|nr:MAG: TetR family transcriptional regulator [Sphingomonadaceae bacterium]
MSTRKRLSPEESRLAALEAARAQLIEAGPQSVTLKAIAGRIGRTHANLLHHFGSAAGLQRELGAYLAQNVCSSIAEAFRLTRGDESYPRDVVDLTFDAFDTGGGGALVSWMLASGNEDALDPVVETIHSLIDELSTSPDSIGDAKAMAESTLTLVLLAFGDALIGERLAGSLGLARSGARDRAERLMLDDLARHAAARVH